MKFFIILGFITEQEVTMIRDVHDEYTRYWVPLNWAYAILDKAKESKRISSDHTLVYLLEVRILVLYFLYFL